MCGREYNDLICVPIKLRYMSFDKMAIGRFKKIAKKPIRVTKAIDEIFKGLKLTLYFRSLLRAKKMSDGIRINPYSLTMNQL